MNPLGASAKGTPPENREKAGQKAGAPRIAALCKRGLLAGWNRASRGREGHPGGTPSIERPVEAPAPPDRFDHVLTGLAAESQGFSKGD